MNNKDLIVIFRRASEFLEISDSLNLLCLNHYFLNHLPNQEFYAYLSVSIAKIIADISASSTDVKTKLSAFLEWQPFNSCEDLFNCIKYSNNLIKNPCGSQRFDHWERIDGGNGWSIENWGCYKDNKTVFVSSYGWSTLNQTIDLPESNKKRFLLLGAYIARRVDCGADIKIEVIFYDYDHNRLDSWHIEENDIPGTGVIQSYSQLTSLNDFAHPSDSFGDLYPYKHYKLRVNIKPGKKYAIVSFSGKDTKWWAGHYGARFGYCYARIFYEE
ncbi:unnamed protein product [Blepharisma stoltei]|uniref:FBA domain-containing protein n=1 Tax=Blepharisma stoltei TaxID=1481888 RepID=A0AAU9IPM6_9CILI|nr:unnamed protein product [Blepharisma stoltei]